MTRRLSLLAVAVAVASYDIVAFKTKRCPTITHLVHVTRLHFRPARPHCEGCSCVVVRPLPPRRPAYHGFHTSVPS